MPDPAGAHDTRERECAMTEARQTWTDSDGYERTWNEWGFNSFTTQEGATLSAAGLGRTGTTWYIWRLADGTFDFTASPGSDTTGLPGHPAELVGRIKVLRTSGAEYRELPLEAGNDG